MPDSARLVLLRRSEFVLGCLLVAVSFAPWWTYREFAQTRSAWSGPHAAWLAVLLCAAVVAGHATGIVTGRWALAGTAVAIAFATSGWLAELTGVFAAPREGSGQLVWVLQEQGAEIPRSPGPFDVAWGFTTGIVLMVLALAAVFVTHRTREHF